MDLEKLRELASAFVAQAQPAIGAAMKYFSKPARGQREGESGPEFMNRLLASPGGAFAPMGIMVPAGAAARQYATEMLKEGKGLKDLWRELKTTPIPGNRLAKEVPDVGARLLVDPAEAVSGRPLAKVLQHDELFAHQPWMENIPVNTNPNVVSGAGGMFHPSSGITTFGDVGKEDMISTLLHEAQHGVQHKYGWPYGTSPDFEAVRAFNDSNLALIDASRTLKVPPGQVPGKLKELFGPEVSFKDIGNFFYNRSAGEQQAFATEARKLLQPEELAVRHPFFDYTALPTSTIARAADPATGLVSSGPSSPAFSEELLQLIRAASQPR